VKFGVFMYESIVSLLKSWLGLAVRVVMYDSLHLVVAVVLVFQCVTVYQ
jgi:hypothetical protein